MCQHSEAGHGPKPILQSNGRQFPQALAQSMMDIHEVGGDDLM